MKRKLLFVMSLMFLGLSSPVLACEVCKTQQPKVMQNITHGAGPQAESDFIITAIAVVIVLFTLIFSIKYLLKPGENSPDHVKRTVLENY